MTIATVDVTQQQNYQQTSFQNRKVTLLTPAKNLQPQHNIASPTLASNLIKPSTSQIPHSQQEVEQVTYEKPKDIKLQLMMLVLERFIGRELDISEFSFNPDNEHSSNVIANSKSSFNKIFSSVNDELINIDGQSFQQGDVVSVEEWHSHEQHLNYQIQGVFNIDDKELFLNYSLDLSSKQVSYSKIEMSAEALKDPIVIQFGSQGLGDISGQKDFAINQDSTLDSLPIFSGDVGYLVFDKNNNQQADNGNELFGPRTGQGFEELALLDSNNNGFIDTEDQDFEQLYIWQPSNNISQNEQWLSLKEANIKAINLSTITTPFDFYDQEGKIQAKLRQSGFAISEDGLGRGVHQIDVRI